MTIPVRWFFWMPCAVFVFLTTAFAAFAGDALASGDYARALAVFAASALCASVAFACGTVAMGKTI